MSSILKGNLFSGSEKGETEKLVLHLAVYITTSRRGARDLIMWTALNLEATSVFKLKSIS